MNLNTSRFSGLSTLLANPAHLAALRKLSTDTTATAADYGLTAKDLSYLGSACECALIDLGDLLETFARMHMDWQRSLGRRPYPLPRRHLASGVLPRAGQPRRMEGAYCPLHQRQQPPHPRH